MSTQLGKVWWRLCPLSSARSGGDCVLSVGQGLVEIVSAQLGKVSVGQGLVEIVSAQLGKVWWRLCPLSWARSGGDCVLSVGQGLVEIVSAQLGKVSVGQGLVEIVSAQLGKVWWRLCPLSWARSGGDCVRSVGQGLSWARSGGDCVHSVGQGLVEIVSAQLGKVMRFVNQSPSPLSQKRPEL